MCKIVQTKEIIGREYSGSGCSFLHHGAILWTWNSWRTGRLTTRTTFNQQIFDDQCEAIKLLEFGLWGFCDRDRKLADSAKGSVKGRRSPKRWRAATPCGLFCSFCSGENKELWVMRILQCSRLCGLLLLQRCPKPQTYWHRLASERAKHMQMPSRFRSHMSRFVFLPYSLAFRTLQTRKKQQALSNMLPSSKRVPVGRCGCTVKGHVE